MNQVPADPIRLRDEANPSNLAERIAGQAARDMAEPARINPVAMARIAERIEGTRGTYHGSPRLGWAVVVGAFLLGIATAASAARLDWVPRWIDQIISGTAAPSKRATRPAAPRTLAKPNLPQSAPSAESRPAAAGLLAEPGPAEAVPGVPAAADPRVPDRQPQLEKGAARPHPSGRSDDAGPVRPRVAVATDRARLSSPSLPNVQPSAPFLAWPTERPQPLPQGSLQPERGLDRRAPSLQSGKPALPSPLPVVAAASTGRAPDTKATSQQTARYLKEVVQVLRVDHSPAQAVSLLDRYANALAGAAFAEEALLLRVEAMLALGQRDGVLQLLDRASLTDVAAAHALLVTRGELRAAANRCAEGIGDFDLVLSEAPRPPKRALLGRAHCREKLGDSAGARSDRERYRREFPEEGTP